MIRRVIALLTILTLMSGCHKTVPIAPKPFDRGQPAEKAGDLWLYQLYSDHFDSLSLPLKQFVYHLYRAGIYGRDIAYDQLAPHGLEIRRVLDSVGPLVADTADRFDRELNQYSERFWAFNGNYDPYTRRKFVPSFRPEALRSRITDLRSVEPDLPPDTVLNALEAFMFQPDFLPILVNKSPATGDAVTSSAVNFYDRGITRAQAEGFSGHFTLNGRLTLVGGNLAEEVYRAGAPDVPPGRMSDALTKVISELEQAREYAPDASREPLTALIKYFHTGEPDDFIHQQELWVGDAASPVDYIAGFVEVYEDPLARRGTFELMVFVEDRQMSHIMKSLAANAAWFEERMPWADQFKKREFTPPKARAFELIGGFGGGGPKSPSGINLPNFQKLRETVGTKNFLLTNVMDTWLGDRTEKVVREFLPTREDQDKVLAFTKERSAALVSLHEVTGHGSGKVSPDLKGDPDGYLKEFYSTLEEARASLVGYWFIGDSQLAKIGVTPPGLTRESAYLALLGLSLSDLRSVPVGDQFEEDHARAGWLMVNYIVAHGGGEDVLINGRHFRRLTDLDKAHRAVGDLLSEIMRIKATGDYAAAKRLVETYGLKFDPALRDEVVERMAPLGLPERVAYIMPELELVQNKMGGVKDVRIFYPRDFKGQMIRFGGLN